MDDCVLVLHVYHNTSDQALRPVRSSVDCDELEGPQGLAGGHVDCGIGYTWWTVE